jgi:hypothetical protein
MNAVVLDMDETIGALASFAKYVHEISPYLVTSTLFCHLLDRNPLYLRPGMLDVLRFLTSNRRLGRCRLILYTNNPNSHWVKLVRHYLETKGVSFDHVIDGVDKRRSGLTKCVQDVLECTRLPKNSQFFFVDDQVHPGMVDDRVQYFRIAPYAEPCEGDLQPTRELMRHLISFLQTPPRIAEKAPPCPVRSSAASVWAQGVELPRPKSGIENRKFYPPLSGRPR